MPQRLYIPRSPTPIERHREPREDADAESLRSEFPALRDHSQDEIICLWRWYSHEVFSDDYQPLCPGNNIAFRFFLCDCKPEDWAQAWEYK